MEQNPLTIRGPVWKIHAASQERQLNGICSVRSADPEFGCPRPLRFKNNLISRRRELGIRVGKRGSNQTMWNGGRSVGGRDFGAPDIGVAISSSSVDEVPSETELGHRGDRHLLGRSGL